jgi:CheY-like chemotaxis protein
VESWIHDLHHALVNLYDPVQLQKSPLMQQLRLAEQPNSVGALRRVLVAAIEALQPEPSVPAHTNSARYYHLLYQRFVEQFPQQEVADDLGLSVRQLRRLERAALQMLAEALADRYHLHTGATAPSSGRTEGEAATPSRQEELAWSQKSHANESAQLSELLATAIKTARPLLHALDVKIELAPLPNLPTLDVQVVAVRQALLSVLTIVARFARSGRITVHTLAEAQRVCLRLHAAKAVQGVHSTEKDESTRAAEDREALALAAELLKPSGGALQWHGDTSQSDGEMRVDLFLPTQSQITVVAVDDNPDTLQLLQRYTEGTRYHLLGVREPQRVLEVVADARPDLILLDIMMPSMDGWELLGRLRSHPTFGKIPIIVATILAQEQLAATLGAAAFLRKPIQRNIFLDLLDAQFHLLRRKGLGQSFDGGE